MQIIVGIAGRPKLGPSVQDMQILAVHTTAAFRFLALEVGNDKSPTCYTGFPELSGVWNVPDAENPSEYYRI
jgi:hypothetical protein